MLATSMQRKKRILLIDDNAEATDFLKIFLLSQGFLVDTAYNGRDGITLARRCEPDMVLCDLTMPDMNGCQVAEALRADARLRKAHLVALTCWDDLSTRKAAEAAGFDTHIVKPANYRSLHTLLDAHFPARSLG